jgi:hypothetical protein
MQSVFLQTSPPRYSLLNWIARHIDQVDRVESWLAPDKYPESGMADLNVKVEPAVRPVMSRVLEVEKIGGIEVGEGSFSAKIIDPLCLWNEGFWHFEGSDGKLFLLRAQVNPT